MKKLFTTLFALLIALGGVAQTKYTISMTNGKAYAVVQVGSTVKEVETTEALADMQIKIVADKPAQNMAFAKWTASRGVTLVDETNATTGFIMPARDVAIVAKYRHRQVAGKCGDNMTWSIDPATGVLTIAGTGAMYDYTEDEELSPWAEYMDKIKTVNIGEGVTSIGDYAFIYATDMTSITLPSTLQSIGELAIGGCSSLKHVDLPEGLTTLKWQALYKCTAMDTLLLPSTLTLIDGNAFAECTGIKQITAKMSKVPTMGEGAFRNVPAAIPVYVPYGALEDYKADVEWKHFTNIQGDPNTSGLCYESDDIIWFFDEATGTLTIRGKGAVPGITHYQQSPGYKFASKITSIVVEYGITELGDGLFVVSYNKVKTLTLPMTLTKVSTGVFGNSGSSMTEITCKAMTPPVCGEAAPAAFTKIPKTIPVYVPAGAVDAYKAAPIWKDFTNIQEMPNSGKCGANLYWMFDDETGVLTITGTGAMEDYDEDMNPAGWNPWGDKITSVVIGEGVTGIGDYAFWKCTNIEQITVKATTPPTVGEGAFNDVPKTITLYVPGNKVNTYQKNTDWKVFTNIQPDPTGGTGGESITWAFDAVSSTLTISGTGDMDDWASRAEVPWAELRSDIVTVTIDEGITSVGAHAFDSCAAMTVIHIPATLTAIGDSAFAGCNALLELHAKPATPPTVGAQAFRGVPKECGVFVPTAAADAYKAAAGWSTFAYIIPEGFGGKCGQKALWMFDSATGAMTVVGTGTMTEYGHFELTPWYTHKDNIKSLTVGEGIISISSRAFYSCPALLKLSLPSTLKNIGQGALGQCTNIEEITVKALTPPVTGSIDAFANMREDIPVYVPAGTVAAYRAATSWSHFIYIRTADGNSGTCGADLTWTFDPATGTLTITGSGAMDNWAEDEPKVPWDAVMEDIKTVVMSDEVTNIGDYAFIRATNLETINFPSALTRIGELSFYGCTKLPEVVLPEGFTTLDMQVFENCTSLTNIVLPSTLTAIDGSTFEGCTGLTSIVAKMTTPLVLDASVFNKVPKDIPLYVPAASVALYQAADVWKEFTNIRAIDNAGGTCGTNLTWTFDTPTGVLTIKGLGKMTDWESRTEVSWAEYKDAIKTVVMHVGVQSIGGKAFCDCDVLTSVTIPEGVTKIGTEAFAASDKIPTLTLPATLTEIGDMAFDGCNGLTELIVKATTPPTLALDAFTDVDKAIPVYVPFGSGAAYRAAEGWNEFTHILEEGYAGKCGTDLWWAYNPETGVLEITGTGAMTDWTNAADVPWKAHKAGITHIDIQAGATHIGMNAFSECTVLAVLDMPYTITTIGDYACYNCQAMTTASMSADVVSIGNYAFYGCKALSDDVMSDELESIGDYAFYGCQTFEYLIMPSSLTTIGEAAFGQCTGLKKLTVKAKVPPTVGADAFTKVKNDIPVYVPEGKAKTYRNAEGWDYFTNIIEKLAEGIDNTTVGQAGAIVIGREVVLPDGVNAIVRVYNLGGRCILTTNERQFSLPESGIYVLQAGEARQKLILQ